MRTSKLLLATLKETPADAEIISHKLMLRAGLIRKLASGLYTWLPLGLRVVRKIETIVREEMNSSGAQEVLMPAIQPAELWQESERWEEYGPELLRVKDRHQREFCVGPTHEEVITDMVRSEIRSYKQLPANFYQIQTKFRDEIRPRFGVMRAREFIMKDAYSFHIDDESLSQTYELMRDTYTRIFQRIGLEFRAVEADTGSIGGKVSHEYHVLAQSGEDLIAFSSESDFAANVELAQALPIPAERPPVTCKMHEIDTPEQHSIEEVSQFLQVPCDSLAKTLLIKGVDNEIIAVVLRGDHELNACKIEKLSEVKSPLEFATDEEIKATAGCDAGSIGPVGLKCRIIADKSAANLANFICGANKNGIHITGVNWGRDLPEPDLVCDIRFVKEGEASPDGLGNILFRRGIEVGHVFQLGNKYTQSMNATCLDQNGKQIVLKMGCYGIGITRIVAAAIEQNHDDNGIRWPFSIAPFEIVLVPIAMHKSQRLRSEVEKLYKSLSDKGYDVLLDDRQERAGVLFADMDLIGIPHRFVVSDKNLDAGVIEYKKRDESDPQKIPLAEFDSFVKTNIHQDDIGDTTQ